MSAWVNVHVSVIADNYLLTGLPLPRGSEGPCRISIAPIREWKVLTIYGALRDREQEDVPEVAKGVLAYLNATFRDQTVRSATGYIITEEKDLDLYYCYETGRFGFYDDAAGECIKNYRD